MESQRETTQTAPLVSVVMITYNQAHCIAQAIEGVVNQRGVAGGIELIVSDDASTDDTVAVVERYCRKYPDIVKLYRNERNLGLQGNYLAAFKHCRGRYMAMCDADDYWCSRRKLARQTAYMESHPDCAITFHRVVNYFEETGEKSLSNGGQAVETTIRELAASNYITNLSVMYRRDLVDLKTLPQWLGEVKLLDYGMHMLYAAHGKIHYFRRPMGVYRRVASCTWNMSERFRQLDMAIRVRWHLYDMFRTRPEVAEPLRIASRNIIAAMVAEVGGDPNRKTRVEELIRHFDLEDQREAILWAKPAKGAPSKPFLKRLLTATRRIVSRLIPVPRP